MSIIFEKKAKEMLAEYLQAELAGDSDKAAAIEASLKSGGWKITVGPDGYQVIKADKEGLNVDSWFMPKESSVTPYSGADRPNGSNAKAIWITVGILAAVSGIIILIVYLSKRKANAASRSI